MSPKRPLKGLSTPASNALLIHCSLLIGLDFGVVVDQAVLLTQNIENCFEAKRKVSAVFVDLTAAYDTVWYRDFTCKLFGLLSDQHIIRMIMKLVQNRSFTLTNESGKTKEVAMLEKLRPAGNGLDPLLYNIYTSGLLSLVISMPMLMTWRNWILQTIGRAWRRFEGFFSKTWPHFQIISRLVIPKLSHSKTVNILTIEK